MFACWEGSGEKEKKKSSGYLKIHHSSMFAGTVFQVICFSNLDKNMYFPTQGKARCLNTNT